MRSPAYGTVSSPTLTGQPWQARPGSLLPIAPSPVARKHRGALHEHAREVIFLILVIYARCKSSNCAIKLTITNTPGQ
jgi:hypothetical protein